jgi:hypothetical protein
MDSPTVFHAIGDLLTWTFGIFETKLFGILISDLFSNGVILLGFFGLFYWLNLQRKFNAQAASNPDQIK